MKIKNPNILIINILGFFNVDNMGLEPTTS